MRHNPQIQEHKQRRLTFAALITFLAMLTFPALSIMPTFRDIFSDWSPVAIELLLFVLTLVVFFLSFANDPRRIDEHGNIDTHWPP